MNEDRQQERRQTLLIVLIVLIAAIACWLPIGWHMFSAPPAVHTAADAPGAPTNE
jgi:hypothetical protein